MPRDGGAHVRVGRDRSMKSPGSDDLEKRSRRLGSRRRLSLARQTIIDLMYFSKSLPLIAVERVMHIGDLARARANHPERPPWSALFAKAFGVVAQELAPLRQAYFPVPFPHIFEYDENVVSIAHELHLGGDLAVLPVRIRSPETWPIAAFRYKIMEMGSADLRRGGFYRWLALVSHFPFFLRRPVWWTVLNVPRLRKRFFGTFAVTSVGALGAELLTPRAPVTSLLTYGPIGDDGHVRVRLLFDHRVYDGAIAARALARLEEILLGSIKSELCEGRGAAGGG
jgi:hypothetical protein